MDARGLGDQLWCEQLSPVPFEAVAQVERQIERCLKSGVQPALAGSSLGGFYVTNLAQKYGLKAVAINPFVPHDGFDQGLFIGEHEMLYSPVKFNFTLEHAAQIAVLDTPVISEPENFWLLAEEDDEVLDIRYALARYAACRQTVLPGGDHSFTRWENYLDAVIAFAGLRK
jgi:predicted esterase YcpF (UPF0227 family)